MKIANKIMNVSIIIVNYNTCALTRNCLKSVFEQTKDIDFEVIVSDNGSKDGSIEMIKQEFPKVILIENNANLGFGAANNRGLKVAKGEYIFYLNSDTILLNNAVKFFYDYWENSQNKDTIGALGGNLLDEKQQITISYGNFPTKGKELYYFLRKMFIANVKLFLSFLHVNYTQNKKNKTYTYKVGGVDFVSGANLFVKNNEYAYFDERFFLYYEETNLELQLMKKGLSRIIIDGPQIIHLHGKSDTKHFDGRLDDYVTFGAIHFDLSRIKYFKYNGFPLYATVLKVLLAMFWLIPGLYKKTKQFRKEIWKI